MDTTVAPDRAAIRGAIEAMAPEFATLVVSGTRARPPATLSIDAPVQTTRATGWAPASAR